MPELCWGTLGDIVGIVYSEPLSVKEAISVLLK